MNGRNPLLPATSAIRASAMAILGCTLLMASCAKPDDGTTGGTGGSSGTGTGGIPGTGTGGHTTTGTGGIAGTGTGGHVTGTGGIAGTGTGGAPVVVGTGGIPGTGTGGAPVTGTGGIAGTGTGGAPVTGTGGGVATGSRACAPASADVLSDFEEGTSTGSIMIQQGTPIRTGFWYVYYPGSPAAIMSGMSQTPARMDGPILQSAATDVPPGDTATCDKFALHSTGSGFGTTPNNYAGFGASFSPSAPPPSTSQVKNKYDLSAYTGIKFNIKSGSATPPPTLFVEMLTADNQPASSGGTATVQTIDLYNSRGQMLGKDTWLTSVTASDGAPFTISQSWQSVTIPFGTLIPRNVPAAGGGNACPASGTGIPRCQAPIFNPANVLALQFSFYRDPGLSLHDPSGSTPGVYDVWIDDVQLVKDDSGLPVAPAGGGAHPFPHDATLPNCTKPTGAKGKYILEAYAQWKKTFVVAAGSGFRVQRPENNNDTVSEGIGYGMLISVYMNDKTLFDGLWTYWKSNCATGSGSTCLMTWDIPGGTGSATDADEDATFALLEASKQWSGGTYASDAAGMMGAVLAAETSTAAPYIWGGNNFKSNNNTITDPSYFAPAWYRAFATASGNTAWTTLANNVYTQLANIGPTSSNGLYAAWCNQNCTAIMSNTDATNDILYQYDSHRIPWRIGLDYCWNGTAAAKTYLDKVIPFFANSTNAGADGVGRIFDLYTPSNGKPANGAAVNSGSIIGTAASGSMYNTAYAQFRDSGYQFVLDLLDRANLGNYNDGTKSAYSYFNATVGMLSLLTMTGNLTPF
jgi:endo-1,4-beta-D-glucanase Y